MNPATNQCECPENKVEDSSGNCVTNPCTGGKIYNQNSGECNCPEESIENDRGECVKKTPCDNIKDQIISPGYSVKKDILEGKTNLEEETGYLQYNAGNFSDALPVNSSGYSLDLTGTNYATIFGFIHTHLNNFPTGKIVDGQGEINEIYRIFSPADVITFFKIIKASDNISQTYATVISSFGDYTLRFTGKKSDIVNVTTASEYDLDYRKIMKEYSNNKERGFLHFLKNHMNINGLELYKLHKPLFSSTIKIQRKTLKSNGKVDTNDCE